MASGREDPLRMLLAASALLWTGAVGASLAWNVLGERAEVREHALVQARIAYDKDVLYRRWNAGQGGVYVPVTAATPPNPYLEAVPGRDLVTADGKRYTLINPAYMTRQVHELGERDHGVRGHITSLRPIRPENAPDPWEARALAAFEGGEREVVSVEPLAGEEHVRLMRPLVTEEACLRCHAAQGYRFGDIRGGLSVSVPMAPLAAIGRRRTIAIAAGHVLLWLAGLAFIAGGGRRLQRAEARLQEHAARLEEANRFKDLFTDIMAHDLLNPAAVCRSFVEHLRPGERDPERQRVFAAIERNLVKLTGMIRSVSTYSRLRDTHEIALQDRDLGELVREALADLEGGAREAGVALEGPAAGSYPAAVNPMFANVVANLVGNAIKYAAAGRRVAVGIEDGGASWVVAVRDWGEGIPDEHKERLFTRFERLGKEGVKGTGLGLAIARRIVELHGGTIRVDDNPGGGSVFRASVPKGTAARADRGASTSGAGAP